MSLEIAFPFVGDTIGGSHISSISLMKALDFKGYKVLAIIHEKGPLLSLLKANQIDYHLINTSFVKSGGGIVACFEISKSFLANYLFLRKNKFKILHINDSRMLNTWALPSKLIGIKTVYHCRTLRVKSRINNWFEDISDAKIANSKFVKNHLPVLKKKKIYQIYNPIYLKNELNYSLKKIELKNWKKNKNIICVGSTTAQKKQDIFIKAIKLVSDEFTNINFWIIGRKTPNAKNLEMLISSYNLENKIKLIDFKLDILSYIYESDMLISCAINEGHGRTLIEAMLVNTCVIASNSGGHSEIIKDGVNGFLFELDDYNSLARIITKNITNTEKTTKITSEAKSWAENNFTLDNHTKSVISVYEETLKI
ncbi:glycosyltransferase family 4 protein [Alphaproteobacteria bacterium]|nr:glycosyltransferase family 4 protein [Alphaproteobacteria bacterium]